jgi:hypothetical protein
MDWDANRRPGQNSAYQPHPTVIAGHGRNAGARGLFTASKNEKEVPAEAGTP